MPLFFNQLKTTILVDRTQVLLRALRLDKICAKIPPCGEM